MGTTCTALDKRCEREIFSPAHIHPKLPLSFCPFPYATKIILSLFNLINVIQLSD